MVIFPKSSTDSLVPLFQHESWYYMVFFPKLSSDTLVPLFQIIICYLVILPSLNILLLL